MVHSFFVLKIRLVKDWQMDKQIEIEIKFHFTKEDVENIAKFATFISKDSFTDSYFDTKDYMLTKNNFWLRKREENFELKIPTPNSSKNGIFSYQEITNFSSLEYEISQVLQIKKSLRELIKEEILLPYCTFTSYRKKYKYNEFTFDFDETDFGFSIGELEIIVTEDSLKQGQEKLENYFNSLNLKKSKSIGKLVEFIKERNPEQYKIIQNLLKNK